MMTTDELIAAFEAMHPMEQLDVLNRIYNNMYDCPPEEVHRAVNTALGMQPTEDEFDEDEPIETVEDADFVFGRKAIEAAMRRIKEEQADWR